jgi:BASS family bile acid:Na+ symporter
MSAQEALTKIFEVGLVVMLLTLIASLGMTFTVKQILAPLTAVWLLIATIVLNTILAPLVAIGVCEVLPLADHARTGLEIVTIAAAAPAALKACELAKRADMAMAVSFLIVLGVLNVLAAPLWAEAIVTGANVNVGSIIGDLALLVLAPLAVGLVVRARYPEHADHWKGGLEKASNIALYIALAAGIGANWEDIVSVLGSWVLVASIVIIVVYVGLGWLAGLLSSLEGRITVSTMTSMRFTPVGLIVIATVLNNQSDYLVPALIFALIDTIIPFGFGAEIGRWVTRSSKHGAEASSRPRPREAPVPVTSGAGEAA